ncbi:MAG: hypothetical protein WCF05_10275 [Chromatiaceae bacterium]
MVIPVLEALDITGKAITADALLTQRTLAAYLLEHDAHYVFTVKDNQPTLHADIRMIFAHLCHPTPLHPPNNPAFPLRRGGWPKPGQWLSDPHRSVVP